MHPIDDAHALAREHHLCRVHGVIASQYSLLLSTSTKLEVRHRSHLLEVQQRALWLTSMRASQVSALEERLAEEAKLREEAERTLDRERRSAQMISLPSGSGELLLASDMPRTHVQCSGYSVGNANTVSSAVIM